MGGSALQPYTRKIQFSLSVSICLLRMSRWRIIVRADTTLCSGVPPLGRVDADPQKRSSFQSFIDLLSQYICLIKFIQHSVVLFAYSSLLHSYGSPGVSYMAACGLAVCTLSL